MRKYPDTPLQTAGISPAFIGGEGTMFYVLFILLFIIIFMLYQHHRERHTIPFTLVLVAYFFAIFSMMIYYSRDAYYYNVIKNYFYLPDPLWRYLFFLPISRFNVIRLINIASLSIVLASVCFALNFHTPFTVKTIRRAKTAIRIYLLLQLLIYDPAFNIRCYYFLYPAFLGSRQFYDAENIIYILTRSGNNLLVLLSVLMLLVSFYHSPRIQLIRYNFLLMTVCFFTLSTLYFTFISRTPSFLLRISKIAQSYYFWYINLGNSVVFYNIFPFIFIVFLLLICYSLYRLTHISHQINAEAFEISKQIDATETTSKVFCHYIKNELLAIQSGLELLPAAVNPEKALQEAKDRCEKLYSRIDEIHKNTKTSELHLIDIDLKDLLEKVLSPFCAETAGIEIRKNFAEYPVLALADPVYLEQALTNIIGNAMDAMAAKEESAGIPAERTLTVNLRYTDDWILLEIQDTGTGISENNIKKIFTPFFSSKPTARHWGIGLSLTYRIIQAHEGKIEVRSTLGKGTSFQILLPKITQIFTEKRKINGK